MARSLAQIAQQTRVLHRDYRLGGEVLHKCDLLGGERAHFLPIDRDEPEHGPVLAKGYRKYRAYSAKLDHCTRVRIARAIWFGGHQIHDLERTPCLDGSGECAAGYRDRRRIRPEVGIRRRNAALRRGIETLAIICVERAECCLA